MLKKSSDFGLEGETKELSVLFADIRGFTTLSEGMSATDLKNLLNDYLSPMTEVIFNEKGTIDKYIGDMIMAFWGAPLNDLQHAEHAISAALKMQRKLTLLNETFQKRKWPEIHIGIGVNTGSMNVGDMGSRFRKAYTVLGDAVNLGSRLESLTKYYQVKILVGEETYQKTESLFIYRPIDRVQVKGKQVSTNIYEPIIPKEEATDSILAQVALQKKAFNAYLERQWAESIALFQQLKAQDPQQKLYDLFLTRLAGYQSNPPPDSWDGSIHPQI
jgi:adenylate cyclase